MLCPFDDCGLELPENSGYEPQAEFDETIYEIRELLEKVTTLTAKAKAELISIRNEPFSPAAERLMKMSEMFQRGLKP